MAQDVFGISRLRGLFILRPSFQHGLVPKGTDEKNQATIFPNTGWTVNRKLGKQNGR